MESENPKIVAVQEKMTEMVVSEKSAKLSKGQKKRLKEKKKAAAEKELIMSSGLLCEDMVVSKDQAEVEKDLILMMEKAKACIDAGDQDGAVKFALMAAKMSSGVNENMMSMLGAKTIEQASEAAASQLEMLEKDEATQKD